MTAMAVEELPRAAAQLWRQNATEVDALDPAVMLNLTQVAELTGLKPPSIQVALNSTANTGGRARLRPLSRPRWSLDGVPYWARDQVAAYYEIVANRWVVTDELKDLPVVDLDEAAKRQYASLRGLHRASGVPLTTLHRWKLCAGFPAPAAVMWVNSPTPRVLYSWTAVRAYIKRERQRWLQENPDVDIDARKVTKAIV